MQIYRNIKLQNKMDVLKRSRNINHVTVTKLRNLTNIQLEHVFQFTGCAEKKYTNSTFCALTINLCLEDQCSRSGDTQKYPSEAFLTKIT